MSEDESIEDDETQVEFSFCDPSENDFHVLKAMLHMYLDGRDLDSSLFADTIIDQVCDCCCILIMIAYATRNMVCVLQKALGQRAAKERHYFQCFCFSWYIHAADPHQI